MEKCEHKKYVTHKSNNNDVDITNFHLKKREQFLSYVYIKNRIYIIAQQFHFRFVLNFCSNETK